MLAEPPPSSRRPGITAEERAHLVRRVRLGPPPTARDVFERLGYELIPSPGMPLDWPAVPTGNVILHNPEVSERALLALAASLLIRETGREPTEEDVALLIAEITRPSAVRVTN